MHTACAAGTAGGLPPACPLARHAAPWLHALQPKCLPSVHQTHTPNLPALRCSMSRVRTFNEPADVPWYGSEAVVDSWLHHLAS